MIGHDLSSLHDRIQIWILWIKEVIKLTMKPMKLDGTCMSSAEFRVILRALFASSLSDLWPGFGNLRITKETSRDFRRGSWWQGFVNTSMIFFRINFYGDIYSNQTWNVRPEKRWNKVHGFTVKRWHTIAAELFSLSLSGAWGRPQRHRWHLRVVSCSTMFFLVSKVNYRWSKIPMVCTNMWIMCICIYNDIETYRHRYQ